MSKTAFIFGAGDCRTAPVTDGAPVIAADGGLRHLERLGITPDYILGDFDSLGRVPQGENVFRYPPAKDDTDTVLAAKLALSLGARRVAVYGGLGGREDHSFANYTAAAWLSRRGARTAIIGEDHSVFALTGDSLSLWGVRGTVSVFAFGGIARAKIEGLEYPFEGELDPFFPLGVSNSSRNGGIITSLGGTLLVFVYADPATALRLLEEDND